ncbi:MAG: RNA polymerase sigma factor [Ferruginibacter sp.]
MQTAETHIKALIEGCIRNDRKTQELLYKNYYRVMMNLCLRYCANEADALSVLNTAFLKVFRHIKTYDAKKATLYTWIRTIVINECISFINASKKQLPAAELSAAEELQIEPSVINKIKETSLLQLIQQLAPATKAVFNLFVVEGYGHKEIASMLGISEGTSKWHLNDARKKLQEMIIKQGTEI